jgi:hypothetical protein
VCRQKHMARTALHSTRLGVGSPRHSEEQHSLRGNQWPSIAITRLGVGSPRHSEEQHSEAITRLVGPVAMNKATHEHRPSFVHHAPAQRRGIWRQGLWKNQRRGIWRQGLWKAQRRGIWRQGLWKAQRRGIWRQGLWKAQRRGIWRQGLWKNGRGAELGALSHR